MPIKRHKHQSRFVVAQRASRRHLVWVLVALGVFAAALWWTDQNARQQAVADLDRLLGERAQLYRDFSLASAEVQRLQQRVAVLERAEQVANNAGESLRVTLDQRQTELAALRSDLDFYQRLLGTGGQQQGLAVHGLDLFTTTSEQVFRFELTLIQNLRKAQVVSGRVELQILGTRNDQAVELGAEVVLLADGAERLEFAFKYFQQLEGRVTLPADFHADSVRIRLRPASGQAIVSEYDWQPVVNASALSRSE